MARWHLTFEAINPRNFSERWKTGIPEAIYRLIVNQGHEQRHARIALVHHVLQVETHRLYQGWCRQDKEDSFVYVGRPPRDFRSFSIELPPRPKEVFLVFVLPDGTIDEWTWRKAETDGLTPTGVSGEPIWPPKQS